MNSGYVKISEKKEWMFGIDCYVDDAVPLFDGPVSGLHDDPTDFWRWRMRDQHIDQMAGDAHRRKEIWATGIELQPLCTRDRITAQQRLAWDTISPYLHVREHVG